MVFPSTAAGSISAPITVTVTNTGDAIGTISGLPGAPGTPVTAFHLNTNTCTPSIPAPYPPPAPYPTCTMTFSFRPPAGTPAGVLTADPLATPPNPLTVYLAPNDSFAFSLSAVGTVGGVVAAGPAGSLDGTSCPLTGSCDTLRMLTTGTSTSPPQTVTLKNTGNAALHISNVKMNGDLTGFSKVNDTCLGQTIQAQNTCTLMFTFNATVVGPSQTTVTITDDATPTTQTITLLGGISGPAIVVTPDTDLTFSANVGKQIGTNVTLTNVGSVDVTIQNINLKPNEKGFSLGDLTSCFSGALTAGSAGQSGGTCTFPVNFIPASAGSFTNSIVITTSPSLPITINLHGAAVAAPAADR